MTNRASLPGLTQVRVGITIPSSTIFGASNSTLPSGVDPDMGASEVVWRIPRPIPGSPGPEYTFTVDSKPQSEGTLRIAFTGLALELARVHEFVWEHAVAGAGQS